MTASTTHFIAAQFALVAAALVCGETSAADTTLAPPPDTAPRARVAIADFRYGDILWENDRTAHRIYGRKLEAVEPPSGSGIDAWGKKVPYPFMERQLRTGDQHADHGEGLDFYDVGGFRGAGGLGIWLDYKLWTSRNYSTVRILDHGPKVAKFEVTYAPWPVGVGRWARENRRFELPLGTNFTRMTSTLRSNRRGALTVGIGITRTATGPGTASYTVDRAHGRFVWWGPDRPGKGSMGVALMVDPSQIVDVRDDAGDHLVLLRVVPGRPFVYYAGATWSNGLDFADAAAWKAYVDAQSPNFSPSKP